MIVRKMYYYAVIMVAAVMSMIVVMNHPLISYAAENKDEELCDYEISVPEEASEYVIVSEKKPDSDAETIVKSDSESVYVSDKKKEGAGENALVEKNIGFEASESDSPWVVKSKAESIKKRYNTDWNRKMIKSDYLGKQSEKLKKLHDRNKVKIAVLDSGIDYAFADVNVMKAVNLVEDEQEYENMMNDITGHGTSVASIISDINPDAEIYSVRVLDKDNRGTLSRVVAGIYWSIENGADIINMSFGTVGRSEILHKALEDARKAGILMVSSAGNDSESGVEYPAKFDEVVAVGAVDPEGAISELNANGDEIELYAPGEEVFTESMLGLYTEVNGTSVAAPHVAAAASMVWQKDKQKDCEFVRGLLDASSNKPDKGEDDAGIVDVAFAEKLYDTYENTPESELPENTSDIETYDSGQVSARWGTLGGGHKTLMSFGISKLKSGTLTDAEVTALKNGSVYPDKANLSHECYHGRRTTNWIASYKYLTAMARRMRSSYSSFSQPTGQDVFGKGTFTSMVKIMKEDIRFNDIYWNSNDEPARSSNEAKWDKWRKSGTYKNWGDAAILRDCNYSTLQSKGDKKQIAKLKSLFIYGLALHDLTDTFAHAAFATNKNPYVKIVHKHDVETQEDKEKLRPYVTDADDPDSYPKRWLDSKYASVELVKHAANGEEGDVLDFEPNDYRVNGTGKSRGYYLHRIIEKAYQIKAYSLYKKAFGTIDCASFK